MHFYLGLDSNVSRQKSTQTAGQVKITGGPDAADLIAGKYGFVNMGQVSTWQKCIAS